MVPVVRGRRHRRCVLADNRSKFSRSTCPHRFDIIFNDTKGRTELLKHVQRQTRRSETVRNDSPLELSTLMSHCRIFSFKFRKLFLNEAESIGSENEWIDIGPTNICFWIKSGQEAAQCYIPFDTLVKTDCKCPTQIDYRLYNAITSLWFILGL